jgi:Zn-dependent peptidase ImmA (M78 family)
MTGSSEEPNATAATAAAVKMLKRFGIRDPRELVLEELAMAEGVLVLDDRLVGAEARLLRRSGAGLIRVDSQIPEPGRRRFAIAHELGHWALHGGVSQLESCTGAAIHGYAGSREEIEASCFAASLLMPPKFMRSRYTGAPTLRLVREAAEELGTTLSATAVRIVETTEDACLVVFSSTEDGVVRWWRRSRKCPTVWLERRQPLREGTVAWDVRASGRSPEAPELVSPGDWFDHVPVYDRLSVVEESMVLGGYGTILTLLTLGG